jgi:hypothetical protein
MRDGIVSGKENNRVGGRPPRICASYWGKPIEESQEWTSDSVHSSRVGLSSALAIDDEYEVCIVRADAFAPYYSRGSLFGRFFP